MWEGNKRKGNEWKGERIKAFHAEKKSRNEENSMGDLRLPRLLGDYAVLQRGKDIHIWGWDLPGRTVSISLAREEADRKLPKTWSKERHRSKAGYRSKERHWSKAGYRVKNTGMACKDG